MHALPYLFAWSIPATVFAGLWLGGAGTFLTVAFVFGLVPVLDALLGTSLRNPPEHEPPSPLYDAVLRGWIPVHLATLGYGLHVASSGALSGLELAGLTVSLGLTGGAGINVGHELMHRREAHDRGLAELLLTLTSYTWFCVEHVFGHHKHVATPGDPATARLGESVYRFLPRTLAGGVRSAWAFETRRVERSGQAGTWRDRRLRYSALLACAYALTGAAFGLPGLLVFAAQGVVAVFQLEVINYVEHYGLARRELEPGRYERVLPQHSWSSAHRLTGYLLYNLPRHADHHHRASRPYAKLRHVDEAPQLPAGYAAMFLCALVPPLWRRLMDPRAGALRA